MSACRALGWADVGVWLRARLCVSILIPRQMWRSAGSPLSRRVGSSRVWHSCACATDRTQNTHAHGSCCMRALAEANDACCNSWLPRSGVGGIRHGCHARGSGEYASYVKTHLRYILFDGHARNDRHPERRRETHAGNTRGKHKRNGDPADCDLPRLKFGRGRLVWVTRRSRSRSRHQR